MAVPGPQQRLVVEHELAAGGVQNAGVDGGPADAAVALVDAAIAAEDGAGGAGAVGRAHHDGLGLAGVHPGRRSVGLHAVAILEARGRDGLPLRGAAAWWHCMGRKGGGQMGQAGDAATALQRAGTLPVAQPQRGGGQGPATGRCGCARHHLSTAKSCGAGGRAAKLHSGRPPAAPRPHRHLVPGALGSPQSAQRERASRGVPARFATPAAPDGHSRHTYDTAKHLGKAANLPGTVWAAQPASSTTARPAASRLAFIFVGLGGCRKERDG